MNDRQNLAEDTWGSDRMFQRDDSAIRRKKKSEMQEEHHGCVPWPVPNAEHLEFCMTFHRMLPNSYGELELLG